MPQKRERLLQTLRFLKWIKRYGGWWKLICEPNNEHISPSRMKSLLEELAKEEFYEIMVVLLYVHKDADFMRSTFEGLLKDMLIAEWRSGRKDELIKKILDFLS